MAGLARRLPAAVRQTARPALAWARCALGASGAPPQQSAAQLACRAGSTLAQLSQRQLLPVAGARPTIRALWAAGTARPLSVSAWRLAPAAEAAPAAKAAAGAQTASSAAAATAAETGKPPAAAAAAAVAAPKYTKISLHMRSSIDYAVLDSYVEFVRRAARAFELDSSGR